jgi:hypothetical protein
VTGLASPQHVVGFPLETTPLNTRIVAAFYLAGAVGLGLSAAARDVRDARIFVAGFTLVTALLLLWTLVYWPDFTAQGVPWPWLVSYIVEPVIGLAALVGLDLLGPAEPGPSDVAAFLPLCVLCAGFGLSLLLAPHWATGGAPWKVTAVLGRVYSAILLAYALGFGLALFERRRAAVRPRLASALVLVVSAAAASLAHRNRLVDGREWAFFLVAGGVIVTLAIVRNLRPWPA